MSHTDCKDSLVMVVVMARDSVLLQAFLVAPLNCQGEVSLAYQGRQKSCGIMCIDRDATV